MQENWLWGFDQFINDITTTRGENMKAETQGWGDSTIATKYVYDRLQDALLTAFIEDVPYKIQDFMKELEHNYKVDTGNLIAEKYHKHNCPAKDGFGCRCVEEV